MSFGFAACRCCLLASVFSFLAAAPAGAQLLPGGGGRIEELNYLFVGYQGTWHPNVNTSHSAARATQSTEPGATVTVAFNGTGIRWVGFKDEWAGIAGVWIDGEFLTTVDTYATPAQYQAVVFETDALAPGPHQLTIQALDVRSGASAGNWVWVDAFEVLTGGSGTPGPDPWLGAERTEQDAAAVSYAGTWHPNDAEANSGGSAVLALDDGARATFAFTGRGVRWIGWRDEWAGIARVFLDGALVAYVDGYLTPAQAQAVLFRTAALAAGPHTIAIEATHQRNANAQGRWVWVDAFDVVP